MSATPKSKIDFRDSNDQDAYQKSTLADQTVVFNFGFLVRHAWVELVDNIRAGDRAIIQKPAPDNNDVVVDVRSTTSPGGGGKLRFRVWATDF
jgi:hypothetical protein